ncbi:hypothetical protein SAMN04488598_12124 [Halanaerobium congolense]|jgi:hypothetical protein|uniref:Uncharacterized protein n=1 Tax=Halanaerobium congolense TaxID=54121 RepID=A0A1I0BI63_9FIRM|nr:hypothetical protein [Halanaerobium congolense]PTX16052.1 hypothetical protein C7953_0755 [Halanaerobium congolense]SDF72208.1 hypothetical protein SAMN04488598_12124 [Halanaerobium congolense]SET05922.1 hypothetical protein SAMN04515652_12124 [Halanaerobium congolense]SFP46413.1 hypothetical protein SAMN04488596_12124 [Halanaerobium congolense]
MKKYALTLIVLLAAIFILNTTIYAEAVVEIFDEWTVYQDEDSTTGQMNVSIHQMTDYATPLYMSFYQGERTISIVLRDLDKTAATLR